MDGTTILKCFHFVLHFLFTVPTNVSASVCLDIISWSLPPCQANCTVGVNGQDIVTVPCSDGNVNVSGTDLRNKTVILIVSDQLENAVEFSINSNEGTYVELLIPLKYFT